MTAAQPASQRPATPHPYPPIVENRSSAGIQSPLRVVAFNAKGGVHLDGILACFKREPLRSASVILISEADFGTSRSGGLRVAHEMGARLGMSCGYVKEFGLRPADGGEIRAFLGNAILSRVPLEDVFAISIPVQSRRNPLPGSLKRYRREGKPVALVATIEVGGKPLRVCVAHFDSRAAPAGRELQMTTLLHDFPPNGPAIIGGDLNTTTLELGDPEVMRRVGREMILHSRRFRSPMAYEPLFERLADAQFEVRDANLDGRPTFTFSRLVPPWLRPRLDWIALRGCRPVPGSAAVIPARLGEGLPRRRHRPATIVP